MPHYDEARGLLAAELNGPAGIIAAATHAATSKATPVDADELPIVDSASSFGLKKLTWANLKATLLTWLTGVLAAPPTIGGTAPGAATFSQLNAQGTTTIGSFTLGTTLNLFSAGATLSVTPNNVSGANGVDYDTSFVVGGAGPHKFKIAGVQYGAFTTAGVSTVGGAVIHTTTSALTNGAGAGAGTLLNAPVAGNPTKWIGINDNGVTRYIPAW